MARIHDISTLWSDRLAVWPGDVPFRLDQPLRHSRGDGVDLGRIQTTLHAGTHADAPSHILPEGCSLEAVDLEPYLGLCQVVSVAVGSGARILPEHVPVPLQAPRILFRTDTYPDETCFQTGFAALSPELVLWLKAQGCVLVGIDTPSVDPFDDAALEAHHALFSVGMRCLEGLRLGDVRPGTYLLSALPLKILGGDGSPVRAALLELEP